ncbi:putative DNA-directed RNA polymerase subunit [Vibrio phage 150E35-1]|nr:putative DNA-directed RNA polymerase subunit [Vibrio phage 150E35-1]
MHDGDTMAVHLILSEQAYREAADVLMPHANMFQSSNGSVTFSLSHEQVVGAYYLTYIPDSMTGNERPLPCVSHDDAIRQYETRKGTEHEVPVQYPVMIRRGRGEFVQSTIGRCMVEQVLELPAGYIQGEKGWDKGTIGKVLKSVAISHMDNPELALRLTRDLGRLGFDWGTRMGLSICYDDCVAPSTFDSTIVEGEKFEADADHTPEMATRKWAGLTDRLVGDWLNEVDDTNPLKFMYMTKARVSPVQIRQMCIMKGQIANASGGVELVKSSLAVGLNPAQYSLTCKGTRQSLGANHEVVPQSGFLCRQLVHAGRELHVQAEGMTEGVTIPVHAEDAVGRYNEEGTLITEEMVEALDSKWVRIQSPVGGKGKVTTMECGTDPSTHELTKLNQQCGVIMGQTLAEKSTQLALRSKHLSGAISIADDTTKKVQIVETGTVTKVDQTDSLFFFTILGTESGVELEYVYHTASVAMLRKAEIKVGSRFRKDDVVCVYSESVQGADISGTLAQVIKLVGASNPGKSFNYPRAVVAHCSGEVTRKVRTVKDSWNYHADMLKATEARFEGIDEDTLQTWYETTPDTVVEVRDASKVMNAGDVATFSTVSTSHKNFDAAEVDAWIESIRFEKKSDAIAENKAAAKSPLDTEVIDLYVDGKYAGTVSGANAVIVPIGSVVDSGTRLTYGLADIAEVWERTEGDIEITWKTFYESLKELYGTSGVNLSSIHYEVLFRAMIELGYDEKGQLVTRSACPEAVPAMHTVSQIPRKYPSLIKALNFGYIKDRLVHSLMNLRPTSGCSSEKLIQGGLVPSSWDGRFQYNPEAK